MNQSRRVKLLQKMAASARPAEDFPADPGLAPLSNMENGLRRGRAAGYGALYAGRPSRETGMLPGGVPVNVDGGRALSSQREQPITAETFANNVSAGGTRFMNRLRAFFSSRPDWMNSSTSGLPTGGTAAPASAQAPRAASAMKVDPATLPYGANVTARMAPSREAYEARNEANAARSAANQQWRRAMQARLAQDFGDNGVKGMQAAVGMSGAQQDGIAGPKTRAAYRKFVQGGGAFSPQAPTASPAPAAAPSPVVAPAPPVAAPAAAPAPNAQMVTSATGKPTVITRAMMARNDFDAGPRQVPHWMIEKARAQQAASKEPPVVVAPSTNP
jgi:hypothetical protein